MSLTAFLDSSLFSWVILPVLIFLARICDVSIGTIRIIMIGRGSKFYAALCGFFEVSIWLLVARHVILHLPNVVCFFAYSGGFAAGNFVGMTIEERMAVGVQMIRVIVEDDGVTLAAALNTQGYSTTIFPAKGANGPVHIISVITQRHDIPALMEHIHAFNPKVLYTVEDVKRTSGNAFSPSAPKRFLQWFRKQGNT
ncbi:MAG: DUF2179 domain-containing protein [Deltaproteobacteria bacterium]|nr:DUF2179 domain-containing protein [Deltaproteobacteria bacterium]